MSNDLISRSALRKKVNSFFDSQYKGIVSSDLIKYAEAVDDFIDNAPTVDTTFREVVAYECGQKSVEERSTDSEKLAKIEQICKDAFSNPETLDINLYRAQALANIYHLFLYDVTGSQMD